MSTKCDGKLGENWNPSLGNLNKEGEVFTSPVFHRRRSRRRRLLGRCNYLPIKRQLSMLAFATNLNV